jgi:nucleoside-diphosphate-sugar epimerase
LAAAQQPALKRVLLTGASGFIGRACIGPLRDRGYSVHTISTGRTAVPDGVSVWPGDLLDVDSIAGLVARIAPSHLLHLAWDVTPDAYWMTPTNLDWLAAGTALLHAFRAAGGRRAVGVGSCAEYGWTVAHYAEFEAPLAPATQYGRCKLELSRVFLSVKQHGLSTAWARLFFPFGPGERPARLLPSVIAALLNGREAACTAGTQVRDLLYVDDVAAALVALLDSEVAGPVNIGSGHGIAVRDMIMRVAEQIGQPALVRLGALPMRPEEPPSIVAVTDRLVHEVGFAPQITLHEAIGCTIAYWIRRQQSGETLRFAPLQARQDQPQ